MAFDFTAHAFQENNEHAYKYFFPKSGSLPGIYTSPFWRQFPLIVSHITLETNLDWHLYVPHISKTDNE